MILAVSVLLISVAMAGPAREKNAADYTEEEVESEMDPFRIPRTYNL